MIELKGSLMTVNDKRIHTSQTISYTKKKSARDEKEMRIVRIVCLDT